MKSFFTYEEDEAYRQGRKDAETGRSDIWRNRMANYDTPDKAYFIGQEERRKELERQRQNDEYWDEEYKRWS
jgi:hypothetical protein